MELVSTGWEAFDAFTYGFPSSDRARAQHLATVVNDIVEGQGVVVAAELFS